MLCMRVLAIRIATAALLIAGVTAALLRAQFEDRPLVDPTGLVGYYDFDLRVPCDPEGCFTKLWSDDVFFSALETQLGLKVEKEDAPDQDVDRRPCEPSADAELTTPPAVAAPDGYAHAPAASSSLPKDRCAVAHSARNRDYCQRLWRG